MSEERIRELDEVLRRRLSWILEQRGWTVNAAALELKIAQPVLHRFLSGQRGIRLATLSRICEGLGIPAHELLAVGDGAGLSFKPTPAAELRRRLRAIAELAKE